MKKTSLFFALIFICYCSYSQTAADVFKCSEITWFGVDFSHVKVRGPVVNVGPSGFRDEKDLRDNYFGTWNSAIVSEPNKYNFWKAFRVGNVPNDLSVVNKRNSGMNAADMLTESGGEGIVDEALVKKTIGEYFSGLYCTY